LRQSSKVQYVGRRRRRIVKIVKKKLPTVFSCPSCGEEAIKVVMSRSAHHATIQCAACGLKEEVEASPADQLVDAYCKFTDRFYSVGEGHLPKHGRAPEEAATETPVEEESSLKPSSAPPEGKLEPSEASEESAEGNESTASEDLQTEESPT